MNSSIAELIPFIPLLPLLGATLNGLFGHRFPKGFVGFVACASVLGAFLLSANVVYELAQLPEGEAIKTTLYTWMQSGSLSVNMGFVVDRLSAIMILVITGVGFLIHLYSLGYMSHEPAFSRYFAYLNLFTFAMLVLVLGDSLPVVFVGWEGVGLCSYLLIGFWYTDTEKAIAGKKAFVVNRIGDFGFIVAMMLLFATAGTLSFDGLRTAVNANNISIVIATGACLMLILGATGKSAQIPLYVWLPDAMAGPTPVSALIHAATMVTAGVYLTARLNFLFALAPIAMLTLATIGALTAFFAATIGTAQNDIKKVLAYSTVSQLGFMFIAAGVGAYAVAVFHLVTHAFFKACLFLGSGSVIHGMSGEQDMRLMGGLRKKMPITFWTFVIATLAITGFPLLSGFMSKDAILWNAFIAGHGKYGEVFGAWAKGLWAFGVISAGFTAFYMWRLVFMTFFSGETRNKPEVIEHIHESPWTMTVPLIILAGASIFGGVLGIPHVFGGHDWIVEWLKPIVGAAPTPEGDHAALEWGLMMVSVAIAGIGAAIAYSLYAVKISDKTKTFASEGATAGLYQGALNKWWVDELYESTIVRPIQSVSRVVLYEGVDRRIIDALVNFVGFLARTLGYFGQLFQTGNIQRYLAVFAVALAVLIYGWLMPSVSLAPDANAYQAQVAPAAVPAPAPVPAQEGQQPPDTVVLEGR